MGGCVSKNTHISLPINTQTNKTLVEHIGNSENKIIDNNSSVNNNLTRVQSIISHDKSIEKSLSNSTFTSTSDKVIKGKAISKTNNISDNLFLSPGQPSVIYTDLFFTIPLNYVSEEKEEPKDEYFYYYSTESDDETEFERRMRLFNHRSKPKMHNFFRKKLRHKARSLFNRIKKETDIKRITLLELLKG